MELADWLIAKLAYAAFIMKLLLFLRLSRILLKILLKILSKRSRNNLLISLLMLFMYFSRDFCLCFQGCQDDFLRNICLSELVGFKKNDSEETSFFLKSESASIIVLYHISSGAMTKALFTQTNLGLPWVRN